MGSSVISDLQHSVRSLLARPGFSLLAILTLAVGIGANTAIFSVINAMLIAPLPYPNGERLVVVHNSYPNTAGLSRAGVSIPDYLDRKEQAQSLEDLALYTGSSFNLAEEGSVPERLSGLLATPSLFSTLAVAAAQGRVFDDAHAVRGNEQLVVLSHALWRNRFNRDPNIVGRDLRLSGANYRVLGVMPEGFAFPSPGTQLWAPFAFTDEQRADNARGNEFSQSIGRLKPGATIAQLNAELDAIVARNAERIGAVSDEGAARFAEFLRAGNFTGRAEALRDLMVGDVRAMLLIVQCAVALVLLIAVANVANLLLTRLASRQKELSVRNALGASRARLARQLLIEALAIAGLGCVVGLILAAGLLELLPRIGMSEAFVRYDIGINTAVFGFALGASLLAGTLAAVVPVASLLGGNLAQVINDSGRLSGGGRLAKFSRSVLVIAQVAMATCLLIGAGLLLRSFANLQQQSPGFDSAHVLTASVMLPQQRYAEQEQRAQFLQATLTELKQIAGVEHVGFSSSPPFSGGTAQGSYSIDGLEVPDGTSSPHAHQRQIDEGFFPALSVPLLKGRNFGPGDSRDSEPVVIIDEIAAQKYFKGQDPIGQRIRRGNSSPWATVIGVAPTLKHGNLRDDTIKETLYRPFRQQSPPLGGFLLRGPGVGSEATLAAVRAAIQRVDPEQPVFDLLHLDQRIALSLDQERAPMHLLGLFAGVALSLAAVGIYAILAYSVSERTSELGVRIAIGAGRQQILRLVLLQGGRLIGIGMIAGLIGAALLGQLARAQLFGITPLDPMTFVLVPLFLGLIALFACWLPARRATRVDPMTALRSL